MNYRYAIIHKAMHTNFKAESLIYLNSTTKPPPSTPISRAYIDSRGEEGM